MSKVLRSRLGRGLSSLISVAEDESVEASPQETGVGQDGKTTSSPPASLRAAGPLPDGLPVMRAVLATQTVDFVGKRFDEAPLPTGGQSPGSDRLMQVAVEQVMPNPHQPRKRFDETRLQELALSLRQSGLIQPIVIRPSATESGRYELIAGERRWRAAKIAGLDTMPAIVRQADVASQARLALIENVQREDLNPIERAAAYSTLLTTLGITQQELAAQLGEERSSIANFLRLLDLAEPVQHLIADGRLSGGHGKVLAGVADMAEQRRLAELAVGQQLSVRALESAIKKGKLPDNAGPPPASPSAHLLDLEKTVSRQIGMRVQIRSAGKNAKKGRLVIHYTSLSQFDQLMERMDVRLDDA